MIAQKFGFMGLGAMGMPMAKNILKAGYTLTVFDPVREKADAIHACGASIAETARLLAETCDVIFLSLPHPHVYEEVCRDTLYPYMRSNSTLVDFGTEDIETCEQMAKTFEEKGIAYVDAPVSGGTAGAQAGMLYIFASGNYNRYNALLNTFEAIGDPKHIVFCGEAGMGQVVKAVNQLGMGLVAAANLEAIAFGIRSGLSARLLKAALGGDGGFREYFTDTLNKVENEQGVKIGIKYGQYDLFLQWAKKLGFSMPITSALKDFCQECPCEIKEANRMSPSFFKALMR